MGGCYRSLPVESNSYAVDFKGGQSFGEGQAQNGAQSENVAAGTLAN